jgi:hypothetical protein
MPKTKNDDKLVFLVGTFWCLGLLQETVWLIWNYFGFLFNPWSWFIAREWKQTDHRFIILLTKNISAFILGVLNPLSPSSEKKRRQRHKISHEAKEAQREKSKFAIKRRRDLETKEQTAWAKDKHREKQRPAMKRKREAETAEESHLHREINTLAKKRTGGRDWGGNKMSQAKK